MRLEQTAIVLIIAACAAVTPSAAVDGGPRDPFGITEKYPTAVGGKTWTSRHWANGHAREITDRDPDDPTRVSESRSDRAHLYVDGKGMLQFLGTDASSEPRLHLNGGEEFFFKNVEVTFYYWRTKDSDVDWGGMVVGARSGPEGHSSQFCDAHTYYGRFRNDGTWDFEKELKHPASAVRSGGTIWGGRTLPASEWIGMKYAVYNVTVDSKPAIKLELYRDLTGGASGGDWEKIGETVDSGGWAPPQGGGVCSGYTRDYVPSKGGGVIVLRNTGSIKDSYRWMTVREIAPPSS